MDYFISRDEQKYGPYTLADLQRYVASGEISLSDLVTSEALTEPIPVASVIGSIAAAPPPVAAPVPVYSLYPDPPNLHWGLVLLFSVLTCGIFTVAWDIVQSVWLKKVEPSSKAIFIYCGALVFLVGIFVEAFVHVSSPGVADITPLFRLGYYIILLTARFSFKNSMEQHFNQAEPLGLSLSGVMTFFFGSIYFQYHINDIIRRKAADQLFAVAR